MTQNIHIWPQETTEDGEWLTVRAGVELPGGRSEILWYRFPAVYRPALASDGNHLVLATLFLAMRAGADLYVHGRVSPALLANLDEFQAAWRAWRPGYYSVIDIRPDEEGENLALREDETVMTFSGGVDSSFTAFRHRRGLAGRRTQPLRAGIFLHGFDIPLRMEEEYQRAAHKARAMLDSLGMETIPMATNLKKLFDGKDWEDAHGCILASCQMLLAGRFSSGLIASSHSYAYMDLPWGSNPMTDAYLSSGGFRVVHDGAGFARIDKIRQIGDWPEARRNLRVCLVNQRRSENCCRCEKCMRIMLLFRVLGLGLPECFAHDVSLRQILGLRYPLYLETYDTILAQAARQGVADSWVTALKLARTLNHWRHSLYRTAPGKWVRRLRRKLRL